MMQILRRLLRNRKGVGNLSYETATVGVAALVIMGVVLGVISQLGTSTQKTGQASSKIMDIRATEDVVDQIIGMSCPYNKGDTRNKKDRCEELCDDAFEGFQETIDECKAKCGEKC